ncbi:MAG: nucleotide sugar dehydrogenase [Legionellales bacterium]|nr:nucleotide sugar dehydrogenase [Legionellales bacterium]|tara:strand:- start:3347 stop:4516 length:1170 start_codon:yes stop_codon:yes gene_type:complete
MKKICIIGGAGHIGLPLALKFSEKNFVVDVIDKNKRIIEKLNNSIFPFKENGGEKLLKKCQKKKKIFFHDDYKKVRSADFIIITVGTPLINNRPSLKQINDVIAKLLLYLNDKQSIILRSTIFPGATKKIYNKINKFYKKIGLSYCPERVAQGKSLDEIKKLKQIVSSNSKSEEKKILRLFKKICNDVSACSFEEAEFIKLFSNAWRYIKFAASNEFYMLSRNKGIEYKKIHKLMTDRYPRNMDMPTQGFAAGPCLPKDAVQLFLSDRLNSNLIKNSHLINERLPNFFVNDLKNKIKLKGKKIGILGTTFKSEIDDERDSLSIKLKKILTRNGAKVYCNDPYVINKDYQSIKYIKKKCDIIFIATPHLKYKKLKFDKKIVIDCWDFLSD